jgi:hypothetical protein
MRYQSHSDEHRRLGRHRGGEVPAGERQVADNEAAAWRPLSTPTPAGVVAGEPGGGWRGNRTAGCGGLGDWPEVMMAQTQDRIRAKVEATRTIQATEGFGAQGVAIRTMAEVEPCR